MTNSMTLQQAHNLLATFEKTDQAPPVSDVRMALHCVTDASDDQILGILADSFAEGVHALTAYATAFGYVVTETLEPIEGPVYIKFNPQTDLCYCESYTGAHRGVLVSCQSAVEGGLNHMYGHLPLNLWS